MSKIPKLESLSTDDKIAQLFIMGFQGNDCSADSDIARTIREDKPGGVILFNQDMVNNKPVHNIESPEQVRSLTSTLKNYSDTPLFIGIDQEGGVVNRLKPAYGFPETRSHKALGALDSAEETQKEGAHISSILKEMGINLNFAPCVDVAIHPQGSIIARKERSFGDTAEHVIKHAEAYIKGHQKNEVITCCKHFPGHGSAEGDTHAGFVDVTESWEPQELEPYRYFIQHDMCPMIMSAHIFNKNFDDTLPSTLSRNVLTDLLRNELKFEGVIISDDMQMRAISDHYSLKESLEMGLHAGLDMFCFGNNLLDTPIKVKEAKKAILELLDEEKVSIKRIDESVQRILELKGRYL